MKTHYLVAAVAACSLALCACATTGTNGAVTASSCANAANGLRAVTAVLNVPSSAQIPALQTAAQNALNAAGGNTKDKAYTDAVTALAVAQAAIPGLQAIVAGAQAVEAQGARRSPRRPTRRPRRLPELQLMFDPLPRQIGIVQLREQLRDPVAYLAATDGLRAAGWTFQPLDGWRRPAALAEPAAEAPAEDPPARRRADKPPDAPEP